MELERWSLCSMPLLRLDCFGAIPNQKVIERLTFDSKGPLKLTLAVSHRLVLLTFLYALLCRVSVEDKIYKIYEPIPQ